MSLPDEKWLSWQRDHAEALAALQEAQRAYHRTVVGAAGTQQSPVSSPQSAVESPPAAVESPQAESLKAVDAARVRLDTVRARKPE